MAAWNVYWTKKFFVGISLGLEIISMIALQSVVKLSCNNPSATTFLICLEYLQLKKRCWNVSSASLHSIQIVFIPAFHMRILSPVWSLFHRATHARKKYLGVELVNQIPLFQPRTWWQSRICSHVFLVENLLTNFPSACFHRARSSPDWQPDVMSLSHLPHHSEYEPCAFFFYDCQVHLLPWRCQQFLNQKDHDHPEHLWDIQVSTRYHTRERYAYHYQPSFVRTDLLDLEASIVFSIPKNEIVYFLKLTRKILFEWNSNEFMYPQRSFRRRNPPY